MKLTPQQIEAAARELCARRGMNPDWTPPTVWPASPSDAMPRPVWMNVADEIRAHAELQDVIEFATKGAA